MRQKIKNHLNPFFLILLILVSLSWVWLFFIDVGRLSSSIAIGYGAVTFGFVIIVGISVASFWIAIRYLLDCLTHHKGFLGLVKVFFVWAFVEFLVSWLVAVVWMGHNGSWGTVVPFSSLSPWLMWTPFKFLSRLVGYYGLSAAIVTGIFCIWLKELRRYITYYFLIVIFLTTSMWLIYRRPNGISYKATIVAEKLGSPMSVATQGSQLVLLPEYGLDQFNSQTVSKRFNGSQDTNFIGSQQARSSTGVENILILGKTKGGFVKEEQKSRLVAAGEYLPYEIEILLRRFSPSTYLNFELTRAVVKGHDKPTPFKLDSQLIVGAAACSSISDPEDYRTMTRQGATILSNSASLEIFQGSRLFSMEHRGLAKFMAVANARPLLQSSNNWPAFALNINGQTIAEIQPVSQQQIDFQTNSRHTPYTILGEWVVYLGGLWLLVDLIKFLKRHFSS